MIKKVSLKLSEQQGVIRLVLWILLLSLTIVILLFPVHLQFEYHAVESLHIFGDNLLVFGVVFIIWMASLLLLLFSRISEWQRVVLVGIFALVFYGFLVINTPYGDHVDDLVNLGLVKYIAQTGHIPFAHPILTYAQYPGLHLTALSLSEISGLDIFVTRTLFLLFGRVLLAIMLYILFAKSLKNSLLASISVLLLLEGTFILPITDFHAQITAIIFFVILLYFSITMGVVRGLAMTVVFLICFTVLTITYLPIPIFFIFVLGGICVLQKLNRKTVVDWLPIIICLTIFLLWLMYWATGFFTGMVGHIPDLVTAFSDPMERILPMYQAANVNLGESTPLWVSLTKYFWLFIVYILGIIIGIRNLFRFKRLNSIEIIETGGLCGILIFSAICDFAFPGGTQMDRVLMYAPLFTVPIIIRFMVDFNSGSVIHSKVFDKYLLKPLKWVGKHAIVIILVVFLIMALPTFLVNNSNIDTQPIYKYELSEGDFVEANFSAKSLLFISDIETVYINVNYVPDAAMVNGPEAGTISNENGLFQDMDQLVNEFESYRGTAVFVLSERFDQAYRSILKVEPTDPAWIEFTSKISENDLIYNNGHDQIYINQPFE